jgi:hypothetical protein
VGAVSVAVLAGALFVRANRTTAILLALVFAGNFLSWILVLFIGISNFNLGGLLLLGAGALIAKVYLEFAWEVVDLTSKL